ncbi:MAG: hypothetical protein ACR2Q3_06180 [Woeseiaceae bacterium]
MTRKFLLPALAVGTLALAANPAHAEGWSFQIEPYLLGVTIDGDAGIGRVTGADVDVNFDDILDNLDLGGMLHFEARHESRWGFALDYAFMDLSDSRTSPRGVVLDGDVFQGVFEALLLKGARSMDDDEQLDFFAGLRWWNNEVDVTIDPVLLPGTVSSSLDEDWVDVIIGARWKNPISEKWSLLLKGDIGGGGSDLTYAGVAGFRYRIGDLTELDLVYKALAVDYESGIAGQPGYFKYDTTTHGPIIGLMFKF